MKSDSQSIKMIAAQIRLKEAMRLAVESQTPFDKDNVMDTVATLRKNLDRLDQECEPPANKMNFKKRRPRLKSKNKPIGDKEGGENAGEGNGKVYFKKRSGTFALRDFYMQSKDHM